MNSHATV